MRSSTNCSRKTFDALKQQVNGLAFCDKRDHGASLNPTLSDRVFEKLLNDCGIAREARSYPFGL